MKTLAILGAAALSALGALPTAHAGDDVQPPQLPATVLAELRIAEGESGFGGDLDVADRFGAAVCSLGDLDGNGVVDLAVGAPGDDDGGGQRGAVWILFLGADGQVASWQKISSTEGGFAGPLGNHDQFGMSVAGLGDLDQDGVPDLAVGAAFDDDLCCEDGSVWILFLNADGTVKSHKRITALSSAFVNDVDHFDQLGTSVAALGDVDGDGHVDLAVGAIGDDLDGSPFIKETGAVWILFMRPVGTVKTQTKLSATTGGLTDTFATNTRLGGSVGAAGDLDGDGVPDLLTSSEALVFQNNEGRAWNLALNPDGTVKSQLIMSENAGGFGLLDNGDHFGSDLEGAGDLDGDGVLDLLVGASGDDDAGPNAGAVWVLFREPGGLVGSAVKITEGQHGMTGTLADSEDFGRALAVLGPVSAPSGTRIAVGGPSAAGLDGTTGAVHLLTLQAGTWVDQGHALAGAAGEPDLAATGTLTAGSPVSFDLSDALGGAPSTLVVGFSLLGVGFKGGVLVPSADVLVSLPVGPTGEATLPAIWPAGVPGGASLYLQWWIVDAAGPKGLAASNGLAAITP